MKQSESIDLWAEAFTKAQHQFTNVIADTPGQIGHQKYKYATLGQMVDMARPILGEHGFSIVQGPIVHGDVFVLITRIYHKSGQWVETAIYPLQVDAPQQMGKMITYGRRYSLAALLGIAAEEDTDAAGVEHKKETNGRPTWEPDKPGAAYKGSILIHPGTSPGKSGLGPSAYSVKDSSVWKQLDEKSTLDELDEWYAKKATQDEKSRLPWGHQVELFERVIKRGADVAESVPALMAFLDGYDDLLKALKEVDGVRYQSLVEHVLIARKAIKERSSENAEI